MAFQSMMNGSECATGSSPLASLLKQQQNDNSLHQSDFNLQNNLQQQQLRSRLQNPSNHSHEEAERFFQSRAGAGPAGNFAMEGLHRELENVAARGQGLVGEREWANQYQPAASSLSPLDVARMEEQFRQSHAQDHHLTAEFWKMPQQASPGPSFSAAPPLPASSASYHQAGYAPTYGAGYRSSMGMGGMGMGMGGMNMMHNSSMAMEQQVDVCKGKGRFVELDDADWEAQFARAGETVDESAKGETQTPLAQPETINLLEGDIPLDANEEDQALLKSLEETWSNLQSTLNQSSVSDAEMAAWEAQYGSQFPNLDGDSGLGDDMHEAGATPIPWTKENVDSFLQNETPFPFAAENQYLEHPDPFAEGQRLLAAGAPLSEAALAFEAACRQDQGRAEAWRAAGETWAADEREVKGIRALEKAVACGGADAVGAWMSLAVAYVNEGQELRALATLERWLSLAYPAITPPPVTSTGAGPWDASNRIIDLFLSAARSGPQSRVTGSENGPDLSVDPDVQVGLGVLFYSNSDYDRARDCFEAALSVRPNDFLLWNRLGATLANGGLPEEAISAYRKALDLRPTFTRATYNLGVSCLNIGCYHESAEHLLAAIEGQMNKTGTGPKEADGGEDDGSSNLWHTLRRAFLCLDRHDLADMANPSTDVNEFRKQGFEF